MASDNSLKLLQKRWWRSSFFSKASGFLLSPLSEADPRTLAHLAWSSLQYIGKAQHLVLWALWWHNIYKTRSWNQNFKFQVLKSSGEWRRIFCYNEDITLKTWRHPQLNRDVPENWDHHAMNIQGNTCDIALF